MNFERDKNMKSLVETEPETPYRFRSGDYEGRHPSVLMLRDYQGMQGQLEFRRDLKIKDELAGYLEWLFQQAEKKEVTLECPKCHSEKASQFSTLRSSSGRLVVSTEYTCCDNFLCEHELRNDCGHENGCEILPFEFSTLAKFNGDDLKQVLKLYKKAFQMDFDPTSKNIDPQKTLDFFKD